MHKDTWWLLGIFAKGYWMEKHLMIAKCFFVGILHVETPSNHQVCLGMDIGQGNT